MATGLLGLPAELVLRIADFLLAHHDKPKEKDWNEVSAAGDEDEQMRSTEHLVPPGLKAGTSLAQTCTSLRNIVGPQVYRKLYLTNTEPCGESVELIANGPFRSTVKEIVFVGRAPGQQEDGFNDVDRIMPQIVEDILSHLLEHFPHLESLNVGFAFDLNDYDKWDIWPWEDFMDAENEAQISDAEVNQAWRALLNKTWAAIAHSGSSGVKHLKMRHFVPKMASIYSSPPLREFLGGIERFEMSLWGMDNGAGWHSSTMDGYLDGLNHLDDIFVGLTNCQDFALQASEYCYVGLEGMRHTPLRLLPPHMPHLKRLTLHHCFASPELIEFFKEHREVLEEVHLHNCSASPPSGNGLADNGIEWAELFETMLGMTKLKTVEVLPAELPYSYEMQFGHAPRWAENTEQIEEVKTALSTGQGDRRMFMYGTGNLVLTDHNEIVDVLTVIKVSDKYGVHDEDEETIRGKFLELRDQEAWDKLLAVVQRNREKA